MNKRLIFVSFLLLSLTILSISTYEFIPQKAYVLKSQNTEENKDLSPKSSGPNLIWQNSTGGTVNSVAISSDGNYIAVGNQDNNIYLFKESNPIANRTYSTSGTVNSVAISSNGTYIVAGSADNSVYLVNKSSSTAMWSSSLGAAVNSVDISSNGNYIIAGANDGTLSFFSKTSSTPTWSIVTSGAINAVSISSDGEYIVAASGNNILLRSRTNSTLLNYTTPSNINDVAISSNGQYIVAGNDDVGNEPDLLFFSRTKATPLWTKNERDGILSVALSSDGSYIVAGTDNGDVILYHKSSSSDLWNDDIGNNAVDSVAITPDGTLILAGSDNNRLRLYHRSSSQKLFSYNTESTVLSVAISDDGKRIVGGDQIDSTYFLSYLPPGAFSLSSTENPSVDGIFTLKWGASEGADTYTVYQDTDSTDPERRGVEIVSQASIFSHSISGLVSDDYYFVAIASNISGKMYSNIVHVSVKIPPGQFDISDDVEDKSTDGTVELEWSPSIGAQDYTIYIHNEDFSSIDEDIKIYSDGIKGVTFTVYGLTNGKYFIAIAANNATGQTLSDVIEVEVEIPEVWQNPFVIFLIILAIVGLAAAFFEFGVIRARKKASEDKPASKIIKKTSRSLFGVIKEVKDREELVEIDEVVNSDDNQYVYKK